MNVIADAIAFKHELVPPSGPISMIPSEKAHSGISPRGAAKNAAQKGKFESDIDMSLSNSSIGADAPAATFGKTAFADFASVRYKNGRGSGT